MNKPLILVCNDDGITAPGIKALIEAIEHLGDVVIVAPDSAQSGKGHAITIRWPLRMNRIQNLFDPKHKAWATSGTPVDCVKLAVDVILHRKPDVLVSGINHGSNASINVIYSGTMSAAVEGAIEGIPSIGFSLCDYAYDADFTLAKKVASQVTELVLKNGMSKRIALNVNIPKVTEEEYKGIKICRQAKAKWSENFEERTDPHGKPYYWTTGVFENSDQGQDTDEWALSQGFASVVPVKYDLTDHESLPALNNWKI